MLDEQNQAPITKSTNAARQGVTGHNVRWVLAISMLAVIVCFGVLLIGFVPR